MQRLAMLMIRKNPKKSLSRKESEDDNDIPFTIIKITTSMTHPLKDLVKAIAHESSSQSRINKLLSFHDYLTKYLRLPPKTTEVANPDIKEFNPSSLALTCSIIH